MFRAYDLFFQCKTLLAEYSGTYNGSHWHLALGSYLGVK